MPRPLTDQALRRALDASSEPMAILALEPDLPVLWCNDRFRTWNDEAHPEGQSLKSQKFLASVVSNPSLVETLRVVGEVVHELVGTREDGSAFDCEIHLTVAQGESTVLCRIPNRRPNRLREAQLSAWAFTDPLTGLPNRRVFRDRLDQAIKRSRRNKEPFAVLFFDLDGFKAINDRQGHDVGDLILRHVADQAKNCLRGSDSVSRFGGDEFTVLALGIANADSALALGRKLVDAITTPARVGEREIRVTPSVGVALWPANGDDADQLVLLADRAMLRAKATGPGLVMVAASADEIDVHGSHDDRLRKAIEENLLELWFDPIVRLPDQRRVGGRARLAWRTDASRPATWVKSQPIIDPALEREVTRRLVRGALQAALYTDPTHQILLGVRPDLWASGALFSLFRDELALTGIEPSRVIVVHDEHRSPDSQAQSDLGLMAALGVRPLFGESVLVSDGIAALRDGPWRGLTLGPSVIRNESAKGRRLVEGLVFLAKAMGLPVWALDVHSETEIHRLAASGVSFAHGSVFGPPQLALPLLKS